MLATYHPICRGPGGRIAWTRNPGLAARITDDNLYTMYVECQGCGNRGAGLAAAGTRCPFCGGTYRVVAPRPNPGTAAPVAANHLPALRAECRRANEQFEKYRRAVYRLSDGGTETSSAVAAFWAGRQDPEHDRLADRLAHARLALNNALVALGLPLET